MQWSIHTLNRNSPIPLYYQLAELVRERIRQGDLQPGERLPAEHELAALAGISRMTARQAIAYLVREGTLVVRHGAGTFVAEPKLTYNALHLLGFTAEIIRRGGTASSRVLEQTLLTPPRQVAAALELPTGSPVLKLVRLRLMDDLPLLLETSFLPAARYPALEHADLASQSLYALLEQHYQYRLERARETLEATIANEYESRLFGVTPGTPMILLEGVTFLDGGTPAEYFKAIYRGDRFKFELASRRNGPVDSAPGPHVSLVLAG